MTGTTNQTIDDQSSYLQLVDPRLKLLVAVIAIATLFATRSWSVLSAVGFSAVWLLAGVGALPVFKKRIVWLRWFFLFVFLLHLFLTPGFRLLGQSWLSRDGLEQGLLVSFQVAAALAVSLLLTRSTQPEQLAAAVAFVLKPLNLIGLNVTSFARQVLFALHFVPILQSEGQLLVAQFPKSTGYKSKVSKVKEVIICQFSGLMDRADELAKERAQGDDSDYNLEPLPPFWPLTLADWLAVGGAFMLIAANIGLT